MKLKISLITFKSSTELPENTGSLRGFFATKFNEYILLHNHNVDKLVYGYPLIQYKMINHMPMVIGFQEGSIILKEIFDEFDSITLHNKEYEVVEKNITVKNQAFGLTKGIHFYEFMTLWLPLNQKNYENYRLTENNDMKADKLRKVLIGNLLSLSKKLGYTVPNKIKCDIDLISRKAKFKNQSFIAFSGGFMVNFCIPDYLGIGKSVSKGYGTVRKIRTSEIPYIN